MLCHAPQVGSATISLLPSHFKSPREILNAGRETLFAIGLPGPAIDGLLSVDDEAIDDDLKWLEQEHAHIITLDD